MISQVKKTVFGKVFMSVFMILALMIGVGAFVGVENGHAGPSAIPDLPIVQRAEDAGSFPASGSFAPLVKMSAPSVVSVQVEKEVTVPEIPEGFNFPGFPGFLDPRERGGQDIQPRRQRGAGSGVIISSDGYILTNHHVVEDADKVKVVMSDDRTFDAEVVGSDKKTDVAVLKVDASNLPVMKLGNSGSVEVGDIVLAIGNPFGLGQTVTMGIVGATGREFGIMGEGGYEDFIQTDAAINPGNSGGALINTKGELVGVNTAILSRSGGNNGVGFAVPINLAHSVMKQLVDTGRVSRGYMGVGIQPLQPAMVKQFKLPDLRGALVGEVTTDSPAEKAGFQVGDVIRTFNGKSIRDARELRLQVAAAIPGEKQDVTILRDGIEKNLSITLAEFPEDQSSQSRGTQSGDNNSLSGLTVENLTPDIANKLNFNGTGVVVTRVAPNSPSAEAGLRPGDIIQEVNRDKVTTVDEFRSVMGRADQDSVLLLVTSGGGSRFVVIER